MKINNLKYSVFLSLTIISTGKAAEDLARNQDNLDTPMQRAVCIADRAKEVIKNFEERSEIENFRRVYDDLNSLPDEESKNFGLRRLDEYLCENTRLSDDDIGTVNNLKFRQYFVAAAESLEIITNSKVEEVAINNLTITFQEYWQMLDEAFQNANEARGDLLFEFKHVQNPEVRRIISKVMETDTLMQTFSETAHAQKREEARNISNKSIRDAILFGTKERSTEGRTLYYGENNLLVVCKRETIITAYYLSERQVRGY